jgi:hypothetical protein
MTKEILMIVRKLIGIRLREEAVQLIRANAENAKGYSRVVEEVLMKAAVAGWLKRPKQESEVRK